MLPASFCYTSLKLLLAIQQQLGWLKVGQAEKLNIIVTAEKKVM